MQSNDVAMKPLEIRHEIESAGISLAQIGRELGKTRQAVSHVVLGLSRSKPIEACIASILSKALVEVFPQWYGPNQRRRSKPIPIAARLAALAAQRKEVHS